MPPIRPTPVLPARFALKRLHSLTGVFPLGIFLFWHVSAVIAALSGPNSEVFRPWGSSGGSASLTAVSSFIFLPFAFHVFYGFFASMESRGNVHQYPHAANVRYTLQRLTGVFALAFMGWHVYGALLFPETATSAAMGRISTNPAFCAAYVSGAAAAWFHFFNGAWGGLIDWGVTVSRGSQRFVLKLCMASFAALSSADALIAIASAFFRKPGAVPEVVGSLVNCLQVGFL